LGEISLARLGLVEEKREKKMEGKSRRGEEEKMGWEGGRKNYGRQIGRAPVCTPGTK